jgi:hypothetical protein
MMSRNNPMWGAPRIHGELLKLGIEITEPTVGKYMVRRRKPPSQSWRTFLENHIRSLVSVAFFLVPTIQFELLYVFLVLARTTGGAFSISVSRLIRRRSGRRSNCVRLFPGTAIFCAIAIGSSGWTLSSR